MRLRYKNILVLSQAYVGTQFFSVPLKILHSITLHPALCCIKGADNEVCTNESAGQICRIPYEMRLVWKSYNNDWQEPGYWIILYRSTKLQEFKFFIVIFT
jgi:hypothetical protein